MAARLLPLSSGLHSGTLPFSGASPDSPDRASGMALREGRGCQSESTLAIGVFFWAPQAVMHRCCLAASQPNRASFCDFALRLRPKTDGMLSRPQHRCCAFTQRRQHVGSARILSNEGGRVRQDSGRSKTCVSADAPPVFPSKMWVLNLARRPLKLSPCPQPRPWARTHSLRCSHTSSPLKTSSGDPNSPRR